MRVERGMEHGVKSGNEWEEKVRQVRNKMTRPSKQPTMTFP